MAEAPAPKGRKKADAPSADTKGAKGQKEDTKQSVPRPDNLEFEAKVSAIRKDIDDKVQELANLQSKQHANLQEHKTADQNSFEDHKRKLAEIETKIKDAEQTKAQLREKINKIRTEKIELEHDWERMKQVCAYETEADVVAVIRDLEYQMETAGTHSVKKEQSMIKKLRDLQAAKAAVRDKALVSQKINEKNNAMKELLLRSQAVQKEAAGYYQEKAVLRAERQKTLSEREGLFNDPEFLKEKKRLEGELAELRSKLTQLREGFNQQWEAFKKFRDSERERIAAEQEARRKKQEEQRRLREADVKAREEAKAKKAREDRFHYLVNPHANDIEAAQSLIQYLELKLPKKSDKAGENQEPSAVASSSSSTARGAPDQLKGLVRATEEDDEGSKIWTGMGGRARGRGGGRGGARGAASGRGRGDASQEGDSLARTKIHHPLAKFPLFEQLGVAHPRTLAEIPACITQLEEKLSEWKSMIRTPEEVELELAAEEERLAAEANEKQRELAERENEQQDSAAVSSPGGPDKKKDSSWKVKAPSTEGASADASAADPSNEHKDEESPPATLQDGDS